MTLRNSSLGWGTYRLSAVVQSKAKSLASMSRGSLFTPTSAPTMPDTMAALPATSPPSMMVYFRYFRKRESRLLPGFDLSRK